MTRKEFLLLVGSYAVLILALIMICVFVINSALDRESAAPCTPIEQKEAA